jgi:dUTP pyrophosphatase
MKLKLKRLDPGLRVPFYATDGSVGLDLYAAHAQEVRFGQVAKFPTGIAVEIPPGFEGQVRGRSGLGKLGVGLPNGVGTIDSDYRGEIQVMLVCHQYGGHYVQRGDRIAQLVIAPVVRAEIEVVEELSETERGEGGLGSTGR